MNPGPELGEGKALVGGSVTDDDLGAGDSVVFQLLS